MPSKIFLSYRRDDSAGQTGRLKDMLVEKLGDDCIFMDVDDIPPGVNFRQWLTREVSSCTFLLAVIGNRWLPLAGSDGQRRIENPHDPVRMEIATALQANIPVIPILLDGMKMPPADCLPDDIRSLADHNAIEIRHDTFRSDAERLVRGIKPAFRGARRLTIFEVILFSFCAWLISGFLAIAVVGGAGLIALATSSNNSWPTPMNWLIGGIVCAVAFILAIVWPLRMAIRLKRAPTWSWPKAWIAIGASAGLLGAIGGMEGSGIGYLAANATVSFCWLVLFTAIKRR